jgi:hypothetical protein
MKQISAFTTHLNETYDFVFKALRVVHYNDTKLLKKFDKVFLVYFLSCIKITIDIDAATITLELLVLLL